jgi:hypothetical protein
MSHLMIKITAQHLFTYADRYSRKAERAGKGTLYPTVWQCAKRFGVKQDAILEVIDDYLPGGYLGLIVGFKTGGGSAEYEGGDQQVEAYMEIGAP